ncbi:MAG: hypothetical protein IJL71_00415, partial [Oscillospiraceae bacterium]|nr:hypothetical protein [Oscillospiraceae bacterium]
MKRLICALLCLLFIMGALAACGREPEAPEAQEPDAGITETEEPQSDEPEKESHGLPFSELPDIGSFVDDTKATYFYDDGPRDEFAPRDDYGLLINYYNGVRFDRYPWEDWETKEVEYTYDFVSEKAGLATADGRILSEGSYYYIEEFSPGQGIVYKYGEDSSVMSLDGSWSMKADYYDTFFELGQPYFMAKKDDAAFIYDLNGKKLLDITSFLVTENKWLPDVICMTEDRIVLEGVPMPDGSPWLDSEGGATILDMSGKTVNTIAFPADSSDSYFYLTYLGGSILSLYESIWSGSYNNSYQSYRLYNTDGKLISNEKYSYLGFDKESDTIIARLYGTGQNVQYFRGDGSRIDHEHRWNRDTIDMLDDDNYSGVINGNALLFCEEDYSAYYDIFGKQLTFDIPGGSVSALTIMNNDDPPCALVLSTDQSAYLCTLDGDVLFEAAYPQHGESDFSNALDYAVSRDGDRFCLMDGEDMIHVYSISGRKEEAVIPSPDRSDYSFFDLPAYICGQYLVASDYSRSNAQYVLYYIPDGRLVARNLLAVDFQSGYAVTASLT